MRLRWFKHSPVVGITKNLLPKTAERGERDFYFFSLLRPLRTDFYLIDPAYWIGATANARSILQDPAQFGAFLRMGADDCVRFSHAGHPRRIAPLIANSASQRHGPSKLTRERGGNTFIMHAR
jgi:hypothetical protein